MLPTTTNGNTVSLGENRLATGIILLLWLYIILRAFLVPFTIDEAATFFHYIQPEEWMPGEAHWDANNHLVNTILTIVCYRAFGPMEWVLRLPNVIAGLLYLILAWKIASKIGQRDYRWALFLTLSTCSFLLEYFGFTRGYGFSMAFLLIAIWSSLKWSETKQFEYMILGILSVGIMIYANMSLLISGLIILTLLLFQLLTNKFRNIIQMLITVVSSLVIVYPAIDHSFTMKEKGLLYYGVGDSFWDVTVASLSKLAFFPFGEIAIWLFPVMFFLVILMLASNLFRSKFIELLQHKALLPVALLLGNLVANFSMHYLLGVNYPEDRVALGYMPFLFMSMFFLADSNVVKATRIPLLIIAAIFPIHLLTSANFDRSMFWHEDEFLPELREIIELRKTETGLEPTLEGYRLRRLPYDYQNWKSGGHLTPMRAYHDELGYLADIVLVANDTDYDLSEYRLLVNIPNSKLDVYERKQEWIREKVSEGDFSTNGNTNSEFLEMVNIPLSEPKAEAYLFIPDMKFESETEGPRVSVYGQISDSGHASLDYQEVALDRVKPNWRGETSTLDHMVLLDARDNSSASLKVFFWNRDADCSYSAIGTWKLYALR